jgi:hypothetical protein
MHDSNMFKRYGEMTPMLVEATMRILLRIPQAYQEGFIDASRHRVRRSLGQWIAHDRVQRVVLEESK